MIDLAVRLNEETGNPEDSIKNYKVLLRNLGRPVKVTAFHNEYLDYCVFVEWDADRDNFEHTFFGFTWGAEQKGLQALSDFLTDIGVDISEDDILADWTEDTEKTFKID